MVRESSTKHANATDSTQLFNRFIQAQTCQQTFTTFLDLCKAIGLSYPPSPSSLSAISSDHNTFYPRLKKKLSSSWKAQALWAKLDKRFFGKEYFVNQKGQKPGAQRAGSNMKVVVIGAGPCGLRTAVEMACLGAKVVVLEKRDSFSRNNVLHLWPFIITDLKALGAKKLYGRFCAGAIDHISIRQLQLILLKLSLMLGVEIILNISFDALIPPTEFVDKNRSDVRGWTAAVKPSNHPVSKFQFDVVIGADGKRNTLQGFKRKEFRGKLAIGLTVNFINRNTTAEAKVEEISGVAYIFNQEFFKNLQSETGIDLENIVYYKGETHYFVMTAKKHSLVAKGVLKQDYDDTARLLSYKNVDRQAMMTYAREAADFSTHHQLPTVDFAINQYGEPDIALFDFTCMYASENAALFREVKGHKLLSCLVGDSLLEPFWPMGTGCARGFLAAFDAVWMTRQWATRQVDRSSSDISVELQVLAERESIYRLLHQTTPQNTMKNIASYTIDPNTRYINLNTKSMSPNQAKKHYLADRETPSVVDSKKKDVKSVPMVKSEPEKRNHSRSTLTRNVSLIRSGKLQSWCQKITDGYKDVHVTNMTSSWKSGLAICAIIHQFRPDLINWNELDLTDIEKTNQLAFDIAETQLGISPVMTGKEMSQREQVDKLLMVTYISQFYEMFKHETPSGLLPSSPDVANSKEEQEEVRKPRGVSLSSPIGLLARIHMHMKRKSTQHKHDEQARKKKQSNVKKKEESSPSEHALPSVQESKNSDKKKESKTTQSQSASIDVGGTNVKLRPKKLVLDDVESGKATVSQRASDRISALSSQLISQWEQNAPQPSPRPGKRNQESGPVTETSSASDMCYFCKQRVYIVERLSAEGFFFHRHCFVCSHCGLTLRRGAYEFVEETGKFFCHANCIALAKTCKHLPILHEEKNANEIDGFGRTKEEDKKAFHTPERIELENIRMSMINEPEELSEEAVTRHNFSINADQDETCVPDIEYMSDSSDDDIDWEDMLTKATNGEEHGRDVESDYDENDSLMSHSSLEGRPRSNHANDVTVTSWLDDSCGAGQIGNVSFPNNSHSMSGIPEGSEASDASVADVSSHDSLSDTPEGNEMDEEEDLSSSSSLSDRAKENIFNKLQSQIKGKQATGGAVLGKAAATSRDSFSSLSTDSGSESSGKDKEDVHHRAEKTNKSDRTSGAFSNACYENILITRKSPDLKPTSALSPERGDVGGTDSSSSDSETNAVTKLQTATTRKDLKKYDTLDRVQDYLLSTPLDPIFSNSVKENQGGSDSELSSCISLSSSTTSDDEVIKFPKEKELENKSTVGSVITSGTRRLPRDIPTGDVSTKTSNSLRNNTSVWSGLDDEVPVAQRKNPQKTEPSGLVASMTEGTRAGMKQAKPSIERRLSHESLERRMKLRLRAKNRQLRQESNRSSLSRSSSERSSRSSFSSTDTTRSKEDSSPSPSRGMVIIESSPSIETFLTPTAPPKSRQHSMDFNEDSFHTPLGDLPKNQCDLSPEVFTISPPIPAPRTLNLDNDDKFVSAPTTPSSGQKTVTPQSKPKRELPPLPKVPYLEAISPTGSAHSTLGRPTNRSQEDIKVQETRIRAKLEEVKAEVLMKKKQKSGLKPTLSVDAETPKTKSVMGVTDLGASPEPTRKHLFKTKRKVKKTHSNDEDFSIKHALPMPLITGKLVGEVEPTKGKVAKQRGKKHGRKSDSKTTPDPHHTSPTDHKDKKSKGFFRISPRKKQHKKEKNPISVQSVDGITTLQRKYTNESDREKAILRGERFRILPDPTLHGDDNQSPDEDESRRYWQLRRRATLANLTPAQIDAKITKRVQTAARRQAKLEAQKRLRRAQVIQRQLEEVEVRQKNLEERGVVLEKSLRHDGEEREESRDMQEWFDMVQEKNGLLRYENELMVYQRELQLEDVQSRLQQDLRERMAMDDKRKTSAELAQEKEILQKMLDVVEQRDELVALLEEQRLKERDDSVDPETLMLGTFNVFSDDVDFTPAQHPLSLQ